MLQICLSSAFVAQLVRTFSLECDRLVINVRRLEQGFNLKGTLNIKVVDTAFALYDEPHSHALHASGRKVVFHAHLPPEYRRDLEAYDAVEDTTGLLSIHQIHINRPRILHGFLDGRLGNFMKDNTLGRFRV